MAIMDCYPDRRAVENELGGKWEKVETIDVNGSDVFIYDEDIDGTPLNLNGFMFKFNLNTNTVVYVNDGVHDIYFYNATPQFSVIRNINKNGFNDLTVAEVTTDSGRLRRQVYSSSIGLTDVFYGNYLSLSIANDNTAPVGTIDVYFLRGV